VFRPRIRSLALDVSPLRDSVGFRALWLGQIVSYAGTQMRYVAIPWQVFELTGSTLAVGLVGLVELVPLAVFSILGGAIADSTDRRAVMARAQVGSLATSLAFAALALMARPPVLWLYVVTAVASAFDSLDRPARAAMIPSLVAPGRLAPAMALRQVSFQVTQIVGPAVGGVLIASFDIAWVYVIDASTFAVALVSLRWVPRVLPAAGATSGYGFGPVREGLAFVLRTPLILSIFVIDLVAMIFGMPRAVFPALARETFGMGAEGVGLLYAAPSAGALIGALTTGWVRGVERQGVAVLLAVTAWGVCIVAAGLSLFSLALTLGFLALAGASDVVSAIFRGTMLQEATPDGLRGRVSAANLVVVAGGPRLGDVEAGTVAALIGAPASVLLGGVACLVGTAIVASSRPLRRYRAARVTDAVRAP
jgi:MFS family permease